MAPSWDLSYPAPLGTPGSPALISVQVYRQFFDSFPLVPDEIHERDLWDGFGPSKKMTQLEVRSGAACRGHGRVEPVLLSPCCPTPGDLEQ